MRYVIHGNNPRLLILSGMHGDEHEVIDCVSDYAETHKHALPGFYFIPFVSPSAVARKTRTNASGRDINRSFIHDPVDEEVRRVTAILSSYTFDLCLNFHEDSDRSRRFYLYDSGEMKKKDLTALRRMVSATGASLFTGIDDPCDPELGLFVNLGYVRTPVGKETSLDHGFSSVWLVKNAIARRVLTAEIPGKAPVLLKRRLVEAVFSHALTYLYESW